MSGYFRAIYAEMVLSHLEIHPLRSHLPKSFLLRFLLRSARGNGLIEEVNINSVIVIFRGEIRDFRNRIARLQQKVTRMIHSIRNQFYLERGKTPLTSSHRLPPILPELSTAMIVSYSFSTASSSSSDEGESPSFGGGESPSFDGGESALFSPDIINFMTNDR